MPTSPNLSDDFAWSTSDVFVSNNGAGPLRARILCIADDVAQMERWPARGGRAFTFSLPVRYLVSTRCGWVRR